MKDCSPLTCGAYDAVAFDLLTALLDSWTVWNDAAGSAAAGLRWRRAYLRLTYGCGAYRPYEDLVREAAAEVNLGAAAAVRLTGMWAELRPWIEGRPILDGLVAKGLRLGVVTNCSIPLGRQAADCVGVPFAAIVTAEEAGFYKPRAEPYRALLEKLGTDPARTLFVAGSPADIPGATQVGMPVFWHNRAGLPFVAHAARPLLIADTLHPLSGLAR